jgi:UDPglucose 6-dehydrogenase
MPIYEPGLEEMVIRNHQKGKLHFSTSLAEGIRDCDVAFIAVGTPPDEDGSADLKYVLGVAAEIGRNMNSYGVIVTKSTVPVGTAEKVRNAVATELKKRGLDLPFDIASNPEFLKEGAAIDDFMRPDRIVVGVDSEKAEEVMRKLYKPFIMNGHPLIFMDIPSAEMTKYAANAMLATRISFMNDIANLCEIMGADVNKVRQGIGSDPRIGSRFIYAGIGYGGSCFPKDVKALIKTAKENGYKMRLLESVEEVNDDQKSLLFNKIVSYFNGDLKGKTFAMWGLSFKPNTDDMREAPSLVLIDKILEAGGHVKAYDPVATHEAQRIVGDKITFCTDPYDAIDAADALLIITEWSEFKLPDFDKISQSLNHKVIFDGRNIYDFKEMKELGFDYFCVGLKTN